MRRVPSIAKGLVALEGLDNTGKSTQLDLLQQALPGAWFTHQPSGADKIGKDIYEVLEEGYYDDLDQMARWALHLASHAQHYGHITTMLTYGPDYKLGRDLDPRKVFLDRCWWSAYAYNFTAGQLCYRMSEEAFLEAELAAAQWYVPEVVLLFTKPEKSLDLKQRVTQEAYLKLAGRPDLNYGSEVHVWAFDEFQGRPQVVHEQLMAVLKEHGIEP